MTARDDVRTFRQLLRAATSAIAAEYFLLPVAVPPGGVPRSDFRERVYAYELYHQLRCRWPAHWSGMHFLMGEIAGVESERICKKLGISRGNLWVLLHRARAALRANLGERGFSLA